ncbi:MAG: hypothetical protein GY953_03175, partial [bacterium]|nr:hypothetical protein [bacterium]
MIEQLSSASGCRRRSRADRPDAGQTLLELLLRLAIVGIATAFSVPPLFNLVAGLRVELAAGEIAGALQMARLYAVRSNVNVAVKFRTDAGGQVTYTLYKDGDGDGVRSRDIDSGTDPEERAERPLAHLGRDVRFGFPPGPAPREPGGSGRRMDRLEDPIRFNRSDLA